MERLGKRPDQSEVWLSPLEEFTGMKPNRFKIERMPLQEFTNIAQMEDKCTKAISEVNRVHIVLGEIHENVAENNT